MKRKKSAESGGSWMDTYGDMVTLLLCFFVLLYSISTIDVVKWENLVRSMNPNAENVSQVVDDVDLEPGEEAVPGSIQSDQKFDQLYEGLQEEMAKAQASQNVQIYKGEDYQFITFRDSIFFDGDSYVLREEGKKVLDGFVRATKPAVDIIKEIHVMGHTTQASTSDNIDVQKDRLLSAERSANVVIYLQSKNLMDPSLMIHEGYGQFHPIATFETEEGREKNRRAEILILEKGATQKSLSEYYAEIYGEDSVGAAGGQGADNAEGAEEAE